MSRLSPLDIQHAEFDTGLNGFNRKQVRDLLARVADETEALLREHQGLKDELQKKESRIEELRLAELEMKRAVIAAERIGNELKQNAQREADLIVKEAERLRDDTLREAENRLRETRAELARLQKESRLFREQFRGMLKAFERSLDTIPAVDATRRV